MTGFMYEEDYFTKHPYNPYIDAQINTKRVEVIIEKTHPKSLLEIGCAYGYIVKRFIKKGIPALGMDISEWCRKRAEDLDIPFIKHDVRNPLPFKDKEWDVLYCEGVLEHIEEEYIDDIMGEFERVANKRLLSVSFTGDEVGHVNLKPPMYWAKKIPPKTHLYTGLHGSIDLYDAWYYKDV